VDVGKVGVTVADLLNNVAEGLVDVLQRHLHALEIRVGREAEPGALRADRSDDSVDGVEEETSTVLDGATVLVRSLVRGRLLEGGKRSELRKEREGEGWKRRGRERTVNWSRR
jgi:hypothetical protein